MTGAFRIDIYNAAGTKLNHATQISGVTIATRANRLGELRFVVPQLVALDRGIQRGRVYKLYHRVDGLYGTFYHASQDLNETGDLLTVTCHDQLVELTRKTVGFNWAFSGSTFGTTMSAIVSRFGGSWAVTTDHSSGDFYDFTYDTAGESYFQLLEQARRSQAGWFALSGDKQIKYGRWLDSRLSGSIAARFISVANASGWRITPTGDVAIERMTVREDSSTIVNRVIAVGQGLGATQLSLKYSDETSPYTVSSRGNWDGSNTSGTDDANAKTREYYIEDTASISDYGLNEATVHFDIKPVTNSQADLLNAGNALYTTATAYLLRSRYPLTNYTMSVLGLPKTVAPGSVIEVDYRDIATVIDASGAAVKRVKLRLDKKRLFVAEVSREFDDVGGVVKAALTVSTTGELFADSTEITTELLRDAKRFKTRVAPNMCIVIDSGSTQAIKSGVDYTMPLKYDAAVLELNAVKFVFQLGPLISYANNSTASGGGSTTSSGGSSTQTSSASGSATVSSASGGSVTSGATGSTGKLDGFLNRGDTLTGGGGSTSTWFSFDTGSTTPGSTGGVDGTNSADIIGTTHTYENHSHSSASHSHTVADHSHTISAHAHQYELISHTHTITISAHTHSVTISDHSHTVSIPAHTHSVSAHTHDLAFGVIKDSEVPTGVSVWLDGTQITQIKNYDTGTIVGSTVSAEGSYYVSIIDALQGMADWRGTHTLTVKCTGGKGLVTGKVVQRITIQAIAVAGDD